MSNATLSRADHGHGSRGEEQQTWLATQAKICGGCNEDGEGRESWGKRRASEKMTMRRVLADGKVSGWGASPRAPNHEACSRHTAICIYFPFSASHSWP